MNEGLTENLDNFKSELTPDEIFHQIINYLSLVTHESDLDRQLLLLADLGREITRSDRCTIWLHDHDEKTLWTKVAHGIQRIILPDTMGIVGVSFSTGEDIIINDAYSDPRFDKGTDKRTGYFTRNIIALPLRESSGRVIGVFQAINKLSLSKMYSPLDVQRAFLISLYVGRMLEICVLYNEIRQSREDLKISQERLKNILEATNDGFWDWSISSNDLFISPAWVKFVTGNESAKDFYDLARARVHKDDSHLLEPIFNKQLTQEKNSYEVEYRLHTWNDGLIWVEERGRVMEWSDEKVIVRIVGTFKDITVRKMAQHENRKLEAQMNHVQRLESLGVMAGGVAHDFNNMLTTIIGNAEIAILDLPEDSPVLSYLKEIQRAAQRSSDLTRQLLNYSGGGKFTVEPICINSMITETLELVKASLSKKAILKLALKDFLPMIEGDISQIRQVLMNLIINASDSLSGNTGSVNISTHIANFDPHCVWLHQPDVAAAMENEKYVTLRVSDTGSGIEEKNLKRIFEPFFSTKETGRGLGLAAVLGIVKSHHGGISVNSQLGIGTEFVIQFPICKTIHEGKSDSADQMQQISMATQETIIVADDEKSLLLILTKTLSKAGYNVISADNGAEAWRLFEKHGIAVDLLVLDTNMPEMSGPEVLEKVKKTDATIPVILLSGFSQSPVISGDIRPDAFIQKPFTREEILKTIRKLLEATNSV
ncbi:MAG: response regulator [Candidatus Riflebacteria bacterium]|nr:response regulator [Candidatus Riflebacteria bacterium]